MFRSSTAPSRGVRALLGAALGVALLVGVASPALADTYGTHTADVGPLPDDTVEDYCFTSGFTGFAQEAAMAAMNNLDGQTNMTVRSSTCGAHTDIKFVLDTSIASRASTSCGSNPCDQAIIRLNPNAIMGDLPPGAAAGSFEFNVLKTMCHEVGHAVGLMHSDTGTDCMRNSDVTGLDFWQFTTYRTHHVGHINTFVLNHR
jgi:hypothetical protein